MSTEIDNKTYIQHKWVWLEHESHVLIPVQLQSKRGDAITATSADGETFELDGNRGYTEVHPNSLVACENMVTLAELSEGAILHNLRMRYITNDIYTYISSILISINPYKHLPIYSPDLIQTWRKQSLAHQPLLPHVYSIADQAFVQMCQDRRNQSVIISGESGSGKTEATKFILQYLAACSGQGNEVEQQILDANPIMEAFGNAKTQRNNNSSRFGKWVEISFDSLNRICGAHIDSYLLEKTRVVQQSSDERNYHIFYELLAGATEQEKSDLQLKSAQEFRYLSHGKCWTIDGVDDIEEFSRVRSALAFLQFDQADQRVIFGLLAAILHLGNIEFVADSSGESCSISNQSSLESSAQLLQCDIQTVSTAILNRKYKVMSDILSRPNTCHQAEDGVHALSKFLYDRMFEYLVYRVNKVLKSQVDVQSFIGVLDIFGFEMFTQNRFEQLCINFANEKLQQHFNKEIFEMEQEVYLKEGLNVDKVEFVDNQPCLDVIEKRPTGILCMVDEELRLPKGSDAQLLTKMHQTHEKSVPYYIKPRMAKPVFTIGHYAGEVTYVIDEFLDKNRDSLSDDMLELLSGSRCELVRHLGDRGYMSVKEREDRNNQLQNMAMMTANAGIKKSNVASPPAMTRKPSISGMPGGSAMRAPTVSSQFRDQLNGLMYTLNSTSPHFIRCFKPNELKVCDNFDAHFVVRQLRYLGIKEVVNIRQRGYPLRKAHDEFLARYKLINTQFKFDADRDVAEEIAEFICSIDRLSTKGNENKFWQIGESQVFMRARFVEDLEKQRIKRVNILLVKLQAAIRGRVYRQAFLKILRVRRDLRAAMLTVDTNLSYLESMLAECVRLDMHDELIRNATALVALTKRTHELRAALLLATNGRHFEQLPELLEQARQHFGAAQCLNEDAYVQASQILEQISTYRVDLVAAVGSRNIEQLQQTLQRALELRMNHHQPELDAQTLLDRLLAEQSALSLLGTALNSKSLSELQAAVAAAQALDGFENQLINECQSMIEQIKTMISELQSAMQNKSLEQLSLSIGQLREFANCDSQLSSLLSDAEAIKAVIEREQYAIELLKTAASARDASQIQTAIENASLIPLDESVMEFVEARRVLVELEIVSQLNAALQSKCLKDLKAALQVAERSNMLQCTEATSCQSMIAEIESLMNDAQAALSSRNLNQLNSIQLAAVLYAESNETVAVLSAAASKLARMIQIEQQTLDDLKAASALRQPDVLKSAIEKFQALTAEHNNACTGILACAVSSSQPAELVDAVSVLERIRIQNRSETAKEDLQKALLSLNIENIQNAIQMAIECEVSLIELQAARETLLRCQRVVTELAALETAIEARDPHAMQHHIQQAVDTNALTDVHQRRVQFARELTDRILQHFERLSAAVQARSDSLIREELSQRTALELPETQPHLEAAKLLVRLDSEADLKHQLTAAASSLNVSLMQLALTQANSMDLNECAEVQACIAQIAKIEQSVAEVVAATNARSLDQLNAAVQVASAFSATEAVSRVISEAAPLIKRLTLESSVESSIRSAMLARDMIALEESLAKAVSANFSSALISEGHTMLTSLMDENRSAAAMLSQLAGKRKIEDQLRAELQSVINTHDFAAMQDVLARAELAGMSGDEAYVQCATEVSTIERITAQLQSAIKQRTLDSISKAISMGSCFDHSPTVHSLLHRARQIKEKLDAQRQAREDLEDASLGHDMSAIQTTLEIALQHDIAEDDECVVEARARLVKLSTIAQRKANMESIMSELRECGQTCGDADHIDLLVQRAIATGVSVSDLSLIECQKLAARIFNAQSTLKAALINGSNEEIHKAIQNASRYGATKAIGELLLEAQRRVYHVPSVPSAAAQPNLNRVVSQPISIAPKVVAVMVDSTLTVEPEPDADELGQPIAPRAAVRFANVEASAVTPKKSEPASAASTDSDSKFAMSSPLNLPKLGRSKTVPTLLPNDSADIVSSSSTAQAKELVRQRSLAHGGKTDDPNCVIS